MTPENDKILTEKYDELKARGASQEEIDAVMSELCTELEHDELREDMARADAEFETYLECSEQMAGCYG